ncbi:hypothetical protein Aph02nite_14750 [Actinoplanes philippinensis]|nr:hypothetical protein [Actinoplanes philippinensis]GIE75525.1 hypothetical protein Aph02nite_14750 [Actinoplanes philippinensis]
MKTTSTFFESEWVRPRKMLVIMTTNVRTPAKDLFSASETGIHDDYRRLRDDDGGTNVPALLNLCAAGYVYPA